MVLMVELPRFVISQILLWERGPWPARRESTIFSFRRPAVLELIAVLSIILVSEFQIISVFPMLDWAFFPRFEFAGCPLSFFKKKYYLKS